MFIRYDGEASGGIDPTTTLKSLGQGERSFREAVPIHERQVHCGCHPSCGDIATKARRGTTSIRDSQRRDDIWRSSGVAGRTTCLERHV